MSRSVSSRLEDVINYCLRDSGYFHLPRMQFREQVLHLLIAVIRHKRLRHPPVLYQTGGFRRSQWDSMRKLSNIRAIIIIWFDVYSFFRDKKSK